MSRHEPVWRVWRGSGRHQQSFEAQLLRWRVRVGLAVAVLVTACWVGAIATYGPPSDMVRRLSQWMRGAERMPTTGTSFSVAAGTFPSEARGAASAAALHVAGLPTLLRARPEDGSYQVLVGPYVSTEEAERAQRALASWRLGETRLVVDDSLRGAGPVNRHSFLLDQDPARRVNVMLVAASGTASLVFELPDAPRTVELQHVAASTIDLHVESFADARPEVLTAAVGVPPTIRPTELPSWATPESVLLLKQLFVDTSSIDRVRARLILPDGVQSRIRLEGRRVYLDLAWPRAPWEFDEPRVRSEGGRARDVVGHQGPDAIYRARIDDVEARVAEMRPFLAAVVKAPAPDVLAALQRAVLAVARTLGAAEPPAPLRAPHQQLVAALDTLRLATDPDATGDRQRALTEGLNTFDGALSQLSRAASPVARTEDEAGPREGNRPRY